MYYNVHTYLAVLPLRLEVGKFPGLGHITGTAKCGQTGHSIAAA